MQRHTDKPWVRRQARLRVAGLVEHALADADPDRYAASFGYDSEEYEAVISEMYRIIGYQLRYAERV